MTHNRITTTADNDTHTDTHSHATKTVFGAHELYLSISSQSVPMGSTRTRLKYRVHAYESIFKSREEMSEKIADFENEITCFIKIVGVRWEVGTRQV